MSTISKTQLAQLLDSMIDQMNNSNQSQYLIINKVEFLKLFQDNIDDILKYYENQSFDSEQDFLNELQISIMEDFCKDIDFSGSSFPKGILVPNPNYSEN